MLNLAQLSSTLESEILVNSLEQLKEITLKTSLSVFIGTEFVVIRIENS